MRQILQTVRDAIGEGKATTAGSLEKDVSFDEKDKICGRKKKSHFPADVEDEAISVANEIIMSHDI